MMCKVHRFCEKFVFPFVILSCSKYMCKKRFVHSGRLQCCLMAAHIGRCNCLEDMDDGLVIEGNLTIVNPFK